LGDCRAIADRPQTATIDRPVRAAEQDAEDDICAVRTALARVEASIAECEGERARAERRVENAIAETGAVDEVMRRWKRCGISSRADTPCCGFWRI